MNLHLTFGGQRKAADKISANTLLSRAKKKFQTYSIIVEAEMVATQIVSRETVVLDADR